MPVLLKVWAYVPPALMVPLLRTVPLILVTVCGTSSLLVHRTVVPFFTKIVDGAKSLFSMLTFTVTVAEERLLLLRELPVTEDCVLLLMLEPVELLRLLLLIRELERDETDDLLDDFEDEDFDDECPPCPQIA